MDCPETPTRYWNKEGTAYVEKYLKVMGSVERKEVLGYGRVVHGVSMQNCESRSMEEKLTKPT